MLCAPSEELLRHLPRIDSKDGEIRVRYLVAKPDVDRGVAALIVAGLGYGVGQIADIEGLSIFPSEEMVPLEDRTRIAEVMRHGKVDTHWHYLDVCFDASALSLDALGFAGLLSLFAGDVFGRPYARDGLILQDVVLPRGSCQSFPGPRFGAAEVLKLCGAGSGGFILGLLLKPDLGMTPVHYADVAEAAAQGGVHYIKEDELTLDSELCGRFSRVEAVSATLARLPNPPMYAANATAPAHAAVATCRKLTSLGASACRINGLQIGLDVVSHLATSPDVGVPLHLHRAGYDLLACGPKAISVSCLTKLFRLSGADIVHVGSPLGSLFSRDTVAANVRRLGECLLSLRPSLPVFSRSCFDTLDTVVESRLSSRGMILVDAYAYQSHLGIEKAVRQLRAHLDSWVP